MSAPDERLRKALEAYDREYWSTAVVEEVIAAARAHLAAQQANAGGDDEALYKAVRESLGSYRCQHARYAESNDGMQLSDAMADAQRANDIGLALDELNLLAEHIADDVRARLDAQQANAPSDGGETLLDVALEHAEIWLGDPQHRLQPRAKEWRRIVEALRAHLDAGERSVTVAVGDDGKSYDEWPAGECDPRYNGLYKDGYRAGWKNAKVDAGERKPPALFADESPADTLRRLGTDGMAWAREFLRVYEATDAVLDEGWMVCWFANAIEAGRAAGGAGERKPASEAEILPHYSRALDEIHRLRTLLLYEAQVSEAHLDYASLPKTRRVVIEKQADRMRDAAMGRSDVATAGINVNSWRACSNNVGCLTRSAWEANHAIGPAGDEPAKEGGDATAR